MIVLFYHFEFFLVLSEQNLEFLVTLVLLHVRYYFVLDHLGILTKSQSTERLLQLDVRRGNAQDYCCPRVTSKRGP